MSEGNPAADRQRSPQTLRAEDATSLPEYMPQLDSLRTLAVGTVMLGHFHGQSILNDWFPLGGAGVRLFFVLSGFLITAILLNGEATRRFVVGFYMRRALRLLPLYFAAVAVIFFTSQYARDLWRYYVFHAVNLCPVVIGQPCPAGHLWSLSAEEHFYLLWPFVVLILNRRHLGILCVVLIVLAPIYRFITEGHFRANWLLPGVMDALACGALLAIASRSGWKMPPWAFAFAAGLMVANVILHRMGENSRLSFALLQTTWLPFFAWLVYGASSGFRGAFGWFLDRRWMQYLGKISYGLYVVHFFVLNLVPSPFDQPYVRVAYWSAITLTIAAASWHLYERPFNRLKDRFRISSRRPLAGPTAPRALSGEQPTVEVAVDARKV